MRYDVNVELLNRVEEYNFSDVAKQANGSAWMNPCAKPWPRPVAVAAA